MYGLSAVAADSVSSAYFPRVAGDYCIDPNGDAKTFGESAAQPLDAVCDLFDGECEVYKSFGLKRVVTVQYVDGKGSPGNVTVNRPCRSVFAVRLTLPEIDVTVT